MRDNQRFVAFAAYKPFRRILSIYDMANFQSQDSHTAARNVCRAIGFSVLTFCITVLILADAWHCYVKRSDFRDIALPIAVLISSPALAITYLSIGMKKHQMDGVFCALNKMVAERKTLRPLLYWSRFFFHSYSCYYIILMLLNGNFAGLRSPASHARYETLERRFVSYVALGTTGSILTTTTFSIMPASNPLSYMIFGHPQPQQWQSMAGFT